MPSVQRVIGGLLRTVLRGKHQAKSCALFDGLIDYVVQEARADGRPPPTVVQFGGNDGVTGDPVHEKIVQHGLRAVILEPHPEAFRRLTATYRSYENVVLVNAAVGEAPGEMPLFAVAARYRPKMDRRVKRTALGVSSFSREHVRTALAKAFPSLPAAEVDARIEARDVPVVTVQETFDRYDLHGAEIIQIDIEGYDYIVIEGLSYSDTPPVMINYESRSLDPDKEISCERLLSSHGYSLFHHGGDTLAFRCSG